jgi:uncharacterized membrane-anchored protein YhcB (DUF1043 family)
MNWAIGTVALVAGLALPFINTRMSLPAIRSEAENTIQLLANAERQLQDLQHPFALFSDSLLPLELSNQISLPEKRSFEYEAFINSKGLLVLRAYTKPSEVLKGRIAPGVYELRMDKKGIAAKKWLGLSAQGRSLF